MTTNHLRLHLCSLIAKFFLVFVGLSLLGCASRISSEPSTAPLAPPVPVTRAVVAPANAAPDSGASAIVPVSHADPQLGNPAALVTIVEFTDFQCPFCSRVVPTLKQIQQAYPDQVRIVFKHLPLPFHDRARACAEAANVVFALGGNTAFWKFHDRVFASQDDLSDEKLEKWASESGVDRAHFRSVYGEKAQVAKVDEDLALAAKIGVMGTPGFRINGATLSGAQPFDNFKELIDAELAEAKRLVASGVSPLEVYKTRSDKQIDLTPPKPREPEPQEDPSLVWKVPVFPDDPVRGTKDALVTIVMFSDFQCPFCKRVEGTLDEIRSKYGDKVRIVWKDNPLPFHPRAKPAANLARLVFSKQGDAGFWKAHDAIFASQPALEENDLKVIAEKLGVNWALAKSAIDKEKFAARMESSIGLAQDFGARGTPHFFINGRRVSGAQPLDVFQSLIDEELTKAEALVASGTAKAAVYEASIKDGRLPDPPEKKEVAVDPNNPYRGNPKATIVIQEFSDFQCPFCKRVQPTLQALEKVYPGQVKLVHRNLPLPFHGFAALAAEAAEEAFAQKGNAGFWKYHDELFEAQGEPDGLARPNLEKIAQDTGLDLARFRAALDSRKHQAKVAADSDAASKAGIAGTPAFIINGYFLSGAQPESAFKKLIRYSLYEKKSK